MSDAKKLWNRNFAILWQGQLISDLGNAAFVVAIGFWVLEATKSAQYPFGNTAAMGIIEACYVLPGVLLGPLAGAFADRHNRKRIIVAADLVRGLVFALMGLALIFRVFPFFLIYPLAILGGSINSFFNPAMSSTIPDIVPREQLMKANSARSFSATLSQLMGSSFGGLLYALLTGPWLFFINGVSFLYASVTEMFMRIPARIAGVKKKNILQDMMAGMKYVFGNPGIRTMILTGMVINFFAVGGLTLMTPLFLSTEGFGVARYGYVMAVFMLGMIAGMLAFSVFKIRPRQRASVFLLSILVTTMSLFPLGLIRNVAYLFPLAFLAGIANAMITITIQTVLQTAAAAGNRGKVFGIHGMMMGGLQPIAMAVSGTAGLLVGIRPVMTVSFSLMVLAALPILFSRSFKAFINADSSAPAAAREEAAAAAAD